MWADENSPIFLIELKAVILLEEKNINSQNEVDEEVEALEESTSVEPSKEEAENKSKIKKTGKRAKLIAESYTPTYKTKEEFLSYQDSVRRSGNRVEYLEKGEIRIK